LLIHFLTEIWHAYGVTANLLLDSLLPRWHLFAILFIVWAVFKLLGTPAVKGWLGEWMVNCSLKRLDPSLYRHFHDLYLPHPTEAGTTQIDHVLVSPFGIFVIETKNYRGWIFGSEKQREWTQQIYRRKSRFQNPLHQNKLHVRALMAFLALPEDHFKPVVFFIGNSEFKTPMPPNVLSRDLTPWIKRHKETCLDPASTENSITLLEELNRATDRRTASLKHLAALQARHTCAQS
jgi:hypothetical protein